MKRSAFILVFFVLYSCEMQTYKPKCTDSSFSDVAEGEVLLDKIFLKFLPYDNYFNDALTWNVDMEKWNNGFEKWNTLINSDATLQESPCLQSKSGSFHGIILETKDGIPVNDATLAFFKASPVVASVTHPFKRHGVVQGFTDKFVVKMKENTSFKQLQELVNKNSCKIEREQPIDNQYFISLSKTSEKNAVQMADLFNKTGYFEAVQPILVILNREGVSCFDMQIQKELKNEPAIIRKGCFQHLGRIEGFYFEFENEHSDFNFQAVFPLDEIPLEYRIEGLSVYISGKVTYCMVLFGCIEPNVRLGPIHLFELVSISKK